MIDLKQRELAEWQEMNFPRARYEAMSKDQLIDMVLIMQFALGMAEEVGEVCHHVLKGTQQIREGVKGIDADEVADGVVDTHIFGTQLLTKLNKDIERETAEVTEKVLQRDWVNNPTGKIDLDEVFFRR